MFGMLREQPVALAHQLLEGGKSRPILIAPVAEERQLEPALVVVVERLEELGRVGHVDEDRDLETRRRLPHRIELGIIELEPRAVGLAGGQAEALVDLADADRARLDVGLELRGDLLADPGPTPRKSSVVKITKRSRYRLARTESSASLSRSPDSPLAWTITCRLSGSIAAPTVLTTSADGQRRRVAVEVDDRKLRPGHGVLRHHQRRARLVVGDARRRKLRLAALGRARPDLPGPELLGAGRRQRNREDDSQQRERSTHQHDSSRRKKARSKP